MKLASAKKLTEASPMRIFMTLIGMWAIVGFVLFIMDPLDSPESYNDDDGFNFGDLWYGPAVWGLMLIILMVYLIGISTEPALEILRNWKGR